MEAACPRADEALPGMEALSLREGEDARSPQDPKGAHASVRAVRDRSVENTILEKE